MNANFVPTLRALAVCVFATLFCIVVSIANAQEKKSEDQPKISEGEQQAINKINAASGTDAKLKAAAEFLKKNSKSQMRPRVASYIVDEIANVNDAAQRLTLINEFNKTFTQPTEAEMIKPTMIEALTRQNKFEEALNEGGKYLEKNPEDVIVNTLVAYAGANVAQKQPSNTAIVQKATQTAAKAVELMEADKKPEKMDAAYWNKFRDGWLPRLYQARGMVFFSSGDKVAAKEQLEKSMGIDPYDVNTLLMLSNILNDEYQSLAQKYQTEKKNALLDQAVAKMDELIDILARAAAVMEGDAKFQSIQPQVMDQLKSYYSFRHNNSTDGLKDLIEKYKKK